MKRFIKILNALDENGVRYEIANEDDQIRLMFPQINSEREWHYIVITEDERVHANNIDDLSDEQAINFVVKLSIIVQNQ